MEATYMNGKRIKVNDFKFKYGQETIFINIFGAFKYKKNNNKYVIYSYDNSKLYYGSLFIRDNELVIMLSKNDGENLINKFLDDILTGNSDSDFEVISLDKIISAQIIDEGVINKKIDINKLDELTIPKEKTSEVVNENKKKKRISISGIFFALFIVVVVAFFFLIQKLLLEKIRTMFVIENIIIILYLFLLERKLNLLSVVKVKLKTQL